jgi:hypothetical protein
MRPPAGKRTGLPLDKLSFAPLNLFAVHLSLFTVFPNRLCAVMPNIGQNFFLNNRQLPHFPLRENLIFSESG